MKKTTFTIFLLSLIVLSGCTTSGMIVEKHITIGYCPTMTNLAKEIQSNNNDVSLIPFGYSADALSALNKKNVDAALVGRIAKKSELNNAFEIRLREGLTLIGRQKRFIDENDLKNSIIHSYVSEEKAREYLSENINIVYHDSLKIKGGLSDIILIDWKDYSDDFELVIPVDKNRNKIEKFRMPVLYSFNKEIIDNLKV